MTRAALSSAWWALRDDAAAALAVVAVVAIGLAAATPGMIDAPHVTLQPLADTPWRGTWSSLAVSANAAREQALEVLSRTVWTGALVVLVVAGLTIVALSVARAARRSDVSVRRTVGASRRVLAGAALIEGLVLAIGGVAAGSVLGVLPFAALALTGTVLVGTILSLAHARTRAPGAAAAVGGVPLIVPTVQFALGLLVIMAGTQLGTRSRLSSRSAGQTGTVFALTLHDTSSAAMATAVARLGTDTAVELVSVSSPGTLVGLGHVDVITTDCGRCTQGGIATPFRLSQATNHLLSADSFAAMGLRVAEGRALSDADGRDSPPVAVVSRYLAEREFEGGHALGRQVRVGGPNNWYRVVGVVDDPAFDGIGAATVPQRRVFLSVWQHHASQLEILVRSTGGDDRARLEASGVAAIGMRSAASEREVRGREADAAAWFAGALTVQGWAGVLLAVIGIFTVMRTSVASLVPELALRRALGARRRHVWGRIALRTASVILAGGLLAWWLQPIATAALARALPGVPPANLWVAPVPLIVLIAATLAAIVGPAWRVTRVAPASIPGFSEL